MTPSHRSKEDPSERSRAATPRRLADGGRLGPTFWTALALLSAIVMGQVAVHLGSDFNWDLRNYHLYNPLAVVEGRHAVDHNVANIQTYINPTLDLLLTYPAFVSGGLHGATRLTGAVQGLNIVLIFAIVLALSGSLGTSDRRLHLLLATGAVVVGMTGALTISEIGTTFADLTTAIAVLLGLFFALRSVREQDGVTDYRLVAAAGLVLGIATGLKLTNALYLAALGTGLVLLNWRIWFTTALAFGLAAMVGLVATHGWWSWFLWQETGNPVFPFFNTVFQSPLFPNETFADRRFLPTNWLQALTYPLWFSWNGQTAELKFRDFRFPIAFVLMLALTAKLALDRRNTHRGVPPSPASRRLLLFTVFLALAYVLWQWMFSIQRYAIAIEVLLPTFILVALSVLLRYVGWALFVSIAVVLAVTTRAPDWGRLHGDRADAPLVSAKVHTKFSSLLDDAVVVLGTPPLGYVVTAFPATKATWVGAILTPADLDRARQKIAHRSKVFTLRRVTENDEAQLTITLNKLGVRSAVPGDSACMELATVHDSLVLCEVGEVPSRAAENEQPWPQNARSHQPGD